MDDRGGEQAFLVEQTERKLPNYEDTAKLRIGRSADVLYVNVYAHVICDVEIKIYVRRRKRDSTATDKNLHTSDGEDLATFSEEERIDDSSSGDEEDHGFNEHVFLLVLHNNDNNDNNNEVFECPSSIEPKARTTNTQTKRCNDPL